MASVALTPRLDIGQADALYSQLQEVQTSLSDHHGSSWQIDLSAIETVTTPALQLLLAFLKQTNADTSRSTLSQPSDAFCETIAALGLAESFQPYLEDA